MKIRDLKKFFSFLTHLLAIRLWWYPESIYFNSLFQPKSLWSLTQHHKSHWAAPFSDLLFNLQSVPPLVSYFLKISPCWLLCVKFEFARLALQSINCSSYVPFLNEHVLKGSVIFVTECVRGKVKEKHSQIGNLVILYCGFKLLLSLAVSSKFGNLKKGENSYWKHRNMNALWQMSPTPRRVWKGGRPTRYIRQYKTSTTTPGAPDGGVCDGKSFHQEAWWWWWVLCVGCGW